MPYCPRCGVEVDPSVRNCPLCATALPVLDDQAGEPAWPQARATATYDPAKTYTTSAERRRRAFLVLAAVFGTAALVVTVTDAATSGGVTWSRWPLANFFAVLALLGALLAWPRRPVLWSTAWAVTAVFYLAVLDLCDDGILGWFPTLGLPITLITLALTAAAVLALRRGRLGFNLFGLIPGLAAIELLAVDALVGAWLGLGFVPSWSLVTSLVLFPLTLLFYLLHYALPRTPDLRRIFHF